MRPAHLDRAGHVDFAEGAVGPAPFAELVGAAQDGVVALLRQGDGLHGVGALYLFL